MHLPPCQAEEKKRAARERQEAWDEATASYLFFIVFFGDGVRAHRRQWSLSAASLNGWREQAVGSNTSAPPEAPLQQGRLHNIFTPFDIRLIRGGCFQP